MSRRSSPRFSKENCERRVAAKKELQAVEDADIKKVLTTILEGEL